MMKQFFSYLLFAVLLGFTVSCTQDSIQFPELVEETKPDLSDRRPLKQNQLEVITLNDSKVRFLLNDIDTEKISSIFFSVNREGVVSDTEVTDFPSEYVIENLPPEQLALVAVWAKGKNGLLSNTHTYQVYPLPHPAAHIAKAVSLLLVYEGFAQFRVTNTTPTPATIFFKSDRDTEFQRREIDAQGELQAYLSTGSNATSFIYYVEDASGGRSDEKILALVPTTVPKFPVSEKSLWTPYTDSPYDASGSFNVSAVLDGGIGEWGNSFASGSALATKHIYIHFTRGRQGSENFANTALMNPAGPYNPTIVRKVEFTLVPPAFGSKPNTITIIGIREDKSQVEFGIFPVDGRDSFVADLGVQNEVLIGMIYRMSYSSAVSSSMSEIDVYGFRP